MEPDVVIGPFPFHEGFAHGFSRGWGKLTSIRGLAPGDGMSPDLAPAVYEMVTTPNLCSSPTNIETNSRA